MSVFDSIKGTFQSVQQDIREGLKALTSLDAQPRLDTLKRLRADGVSLDAGADLLYKYQTTWKELQAYTTETAKKAEEVDTLIMRVYSGWDRQADLVSQMEEEVGELPALATLVKKLTTDLGYIQEDFRVVEGALERLENVIEEQEYEKNVTSHHAQLASYKKKKMEEVQRFKVNIAKSHARTMQECDRQRQVQLKERHEAFEEAFSQDMDYFKTHGNMDELKVSDIPIPKVSSLSDITIDDDQKVINDFLASTETTPSKERQTDDEIGVMSEGTFIEDDYTAEYTVEDDEEILVEELDSEDDYVNDEDIINNYQEEADTLDPKTLPTEVEYSDQGQEDASSQHCDDSTKENSSTETDKKNESSSPQSGTKTNENDALHTDNQNKTENASTSNETDQSSSSKS